MTLIDKAIFEENLPPRDSSSPSYEQPHNISLPSREFVELDPVQIDRFREKQHARQKYFARRKRKDERRYR